METTKSGITKSESAAIPIGHINLDKKLIGKRSAGNPQAAFDEEGAGNMRKTCASSRPYLEGARVSNPLVYQLTWFEKWPNFRSILFGSVFYEEGKPTLLLAFTSHFFPIQQKFHLLPCGSPHTEVYTLIHNLCVEWILSIKICHFYNKKPQNNFCIKNLLFECE
jgi:hypothetical protein